MNLDEHLSKEQYRNLLKVAAVNGTNYFTFNIPNTICNDCGHIDKDISKNVLSVVVRTLIMLLELSVI